MSMIFIFHQQRCCCGWLCATTLQSSAKTRKIFFSYIKIIQKKGERKIASKSIAISLIKLL